MAQWRRRGRRKRPAAASMRLRGEAAAIGADERLNVLTTNGSCANHKTRFHMGRCLPMAAEACLARNIVKLCREVNNNEPFGSSSLKIGPGT